MTRLWWQLPNPSQFVEEVVRDLEDGKNIVLCLPEHLPSDLSNAIRSELGDGWDWHRISLKDNGSVNPVHLLFDRFVGEISFDELRNTRTLAEHENFTGKIIWLDDLNIDVWSDWKNFLSEYEQPCRAMSKMSRTLFCVPLIGEIALDPPAEHICLSHHFWRGIVSSLDMLLFTSSLFQGHRLCDLQKRVAISVVTHLALWDFEISKYLADESLQHILTPQPVLKQIAMNRGWSNLDMNKISSEKQWCLGIVNNIDGESKINSAIFQSNITYENNINSRIWKGQIVEILPFIEERRRELIELNLILLKVPFETPFGTIVSLRELEIGHIEYQLKQQNINLNPNLLRLITKLKEMRNLLSHLEPVSQEILDCYEINEWFRITKRQNKPSDI